MKKYTIEDLAQGRCAVINDGSVEELRKVLRRAFPSDFSFISGSYTMYYRMKFMCTKWGCDDQTELPTQSVKDFLIEEDQPFQYEYKWYDVREVLPDERFDGKMIGVIYSYSLDKASSAYWIEKTGCFSNFIRTKVPTDEVFYWCPLPNFPQ